MAFHPNCGKEASLLLHWLEKGVFDALAKGYLDIMTFEIFHKNDPDPKKCAKGYLDIMTFEIFHKNGTTFKCKNKETNYYLNNSDPDPKKCELLERYNFEVMYPSETSSGGFSLSTDGNRLQTSMKNSFEFTQKEVVEATILLLRKLLTMGTTMKPLPKERFLCMRLSYKEEITPLKYEPVFFRPAEENERTSDFEFEHYSGEMGAVSTRHHALSVQVQVNESMETEAIKNPKDIGKLSMEDLGSEIPNSGSNNVHLSKTTTDGLHVIKRNPNKGSKSNDKLFRSDVESLQSHHDKEVKHSMRKIYDLLDNCEENLISERDLHDKLNAIHPSILRAAMQCLIKDRKLLKLHQSVRGDFQILSFGHDCNETSQGGRKRVQGKKKRVKHVTFSPDTKFNDLREEINTTLKGVGKRTRREVMVEAPPRRSKRLRRKMSMVQDPIIQGAHP
eukprot:CAMPEP_0185280598 /NCGR_PEP_ID=MMETSP1359-20130426/66226_1 /TAXON_ID=552665 /ORGANISM="Bigelowiella longifila, Strain CCMP242" /LENGTH=446 /DNA_ID=CAMNT_0027875887 /DNA_START=291 /DNA_END=1631 /DNA_ORIENTATION=-